MNLLPKAAIQSPKHVQIASVSPLIPPSRQINFHGGNPWTWLQSQHEITKTELVIYKNQKNKIQELMPKKAAKDWAVF